MWQLFPDASDALKIKAAPIIERMVFMVASMAELEETMRQNGLIEQYTNGEHQQGWKQSAAFQAYIALSKTYAQLYTKLLQIAPYLPDKAEKPRPVPIPVTGKLTDEERHRAEEEHQARINAEINAAIERQKRERDEWNLKHNEIAG